MGWALYYRDFEIYPGVVPVRHGDRGIVGFQPIAHIQSRSNSVGGAPLLRVPVECPVCFKDATAASEYVIARAKRLIDGDGDWRRGIGANVVL